MSVQSTVCDSAGQMEPAEGQSPPISSLGVLVAEQQQLSAHKPAAPAPPAKATAARKPFGDLTNGAPPHGRGGARDPEKADAADADAAQPMEVCPQPGAAVAAGPADAADAGAVEPMEVCPQQGAAAAAGPADATLNAAVAKLRAVDAADLTAGILTTKLSLPELKTLAKGLKVPQGKDKPTAAANVLRALATHRADGHTDIDTALEAVRSRPGRGPLPTPPRPRPAPLARTPDAPLPAGRQRS